MQQQELLAIAARIRLLVLDVDGVTGGFNFQNAWTTGWLAGRAMAGVIPA